MRSRLFALLVLSVLVGCPKAPTAKPEVELSVLETAPYGCVWNRVALPGGAAKEIARFACPCTGGRVAFSPDLARAVVWFDPSFVAGVAYGAPGVPSPGHPPESASEGPILLFQVELASGAVTHLPAPKVRGTLQAVGVGGSAAVLLSVEDVPAAMQSPVTVQLDGEQIAVEPVQEGMPALAHAWQLRDGDWNRVETRVTTTGWDLAEGERGLAIRKQFGPATDDLLTFHGVPNSQPVKDLEPLVAWTPADTSDGTWTRLQTPWGSLFSWELNIEFAYTTGLVLYQPSGKPVGPLTGLGFTQGNLIALLVQDAWLLAAATHTGAWPRAYDLRTGQLAWASDRARSAVFWPKGAGSQPPP